MTIYIVDIEAVDTRYTKQWKTHLPEQLRDRTGERVEIISGGEIPQNTTPGAFLNFAGTNVYKSNQLEQIAAKFAAGEIYEGDYFLYTDAWNPTAIQLRYMSELNGPKIKMGGMWHAGSYDAQDFLGRLIGDAPWVRSAEHSMFSCYDDNFFATDFHIKMFGEVLLGLDVDEVDPREANSSITQTGWPMEYLETTLEPYMGSNKRDLILYPHRIAPEKQPEIFRDLAQSMPEYEFVICQEKQLTKDEYHKLLAASKLVFSANLQETLGISWYEGLLVGSIPMVPNRLSYSEMGTDTFLYPAEWTANYEAYQKHKPEVMQRISDYMESYSMFEKQMEEQRQKLRQFFDGDKLYDKIVYRR